MWEGVDSQKGPPLGIEFLGKEYLDGMGVTWEGADSQKGPTPLQIEFLITNTTIT